MNSYWYKQGLLDALHGTPAKKLNFFQAAQIPWAHPNYLRGYKHGRKHNRKP